MDSRSRQAIGGRALKPDTGRLTHFSDTLSHAGFASRQVEASLRLFSERHAHGMTVVWESLGLSPG
jgi:hypothetical protein